MTAVIHRTMKDIFLPVVILSVAFSIAAWNVLAAQEAEDGGQPEPANTVADADNPGMALLDQATEAKLRATTVMDLSNVITLCQRAKRTGLSGENLKYCDQLLASSQLQRGLFLAQQLLTPPNVRPGDWQTLRQRTLADLEEVVAVIKDQPIAYLRIAQLNMMPDGDLNRAREALTQTIQSAKDEPAIQILAVRLLAEIEPDAAKRETLLSDAAKNGNPQIMLLHALTLLEIDRRDEAANVLKKMVETESGDVDMLINVAKVLTEAGEHELAMDILDSIRSKADGERLNLIDLNRAALFSAMEKYEDALVLLNSLSEKIRGDFETTVLILLRRSDVNLALDNLEEALKDIEAADRARPNIPRVLEQKYRILLVQENFNDALAVAKKLQEIGESPENFLREMQALIELERYDEAAEIVRTLLEKYPDNEQQWLAILVEIYTKQKAYDRALALVEEQLTKDSGELRWIFAKAGIFSGQKQWDEAVNWLESQIQKTPDSRAIQLALVGALSDKKSFRAAKERIRPLLEEEPDNLMLLRLDSQLSISLGLHSEAVEALTKVVESDPKDYTSINNLAWILATSPVDSVRDGSRAVELAEKAGELTRHKRAFILSTLAAAHAEAGDFEKAKKWSEMSVEVAKTERGQTEEERKELLEHLQKEWECFSRNSPFRELLTEEE